jgi:hypothetical protein
MGGKDSGDTSPYYAVFGMKYHDGVADTLDEVRKCKTIEELLAKYPGDRLKHTAEELCMLRDANELETVGKEPDDLADEWEETSDEEDVESDKKMPAKMEPSLPNPDPLSTNKGTFPPAPKKKDESNLKEQLTPSTTDAQTPERNVNNDSKPAAKDVKPSITSTKALKKVLDKTGDKLTFTKLCDIREAFGSNRAKTLRRDDKDYEFVYPSLTCSCCFHGYHLAAVGGDSYLHDCAATRRWWDSDFISTFATLAAHNYHKKHGTQHVQVMHVAYPNAVIDESEKKCLSTEISTVVAVMHAKSHYAVMEILLNEKAIIIYDGFGYATETWLDHIINVMTRCKLVDGERPSVQMVAGGKKRTDDRQEWQLSAGGCHWVVHPRVFIEQHNTYDCGPIACSKIMELFGLWPAGGETKAKKSLWLRGVVVDTFKSLLNDNADDVYISAPLIEIADDDSVATPNKDVAGTAKSPDKTGDCAICQENISSVVG